MDLYKSLVKADWNEERVDLQRKAAHFSPKIAIPDFCRGPPSLRLVYFSLNIEKTPTNKPS